MSEDQGLKVLAKELVLAQASCGLILARKRSLMINMLLVSHAMSINWRYSVLKCIVYLSRCQVSAHRTRAYCSLNTFTTLFGLFNFGRRTQINRCTNHWLCHKVMKCMCFFSSQISICTLYSLLNLTIRRFLRTSSCHIVSFINSTDKLVALLTDYTTDRLIISRWY